MVLVRSLSQVLAEACQILGGKLCEKFIQFSSIREQREKYQLVFFKKTGFPGVIGCVDGTHINIIRPSKDEHLYFNRKGNQSINAKVVSSINF